MAIYTKHGEKLGNESLRLDDTCFLGGEMVKIWARIQGESRERQYWFSDLRSDNKGEIQAVLKANAKNVRRTT